MTVLKYADKPTFLGHTSVRQGRSWIVPVYLPIGERAQPSVAVALLGNFLYQKIAEHLLHHDPDDLGRTVPELRDVLGEQDTASIHNTLLDNPDLFWREDNPIYRRVKTKRGNFQPSRQYRWHLRTEAKALLIGS